MTVDETETKVRIKTDEQAKNKKRKRPETQSSKTKRKKLKQLKGDNDDVKSKDKATEGSWSAVNIESEKELMSMGLASLEVMDEAELYISRPGKRKKTSAPTSISEKENVNEKSENLAASTELVDEVVASKSTCSRTETDAQSKIDEKKEKLRLKRKERQAKLKVKRQENPDLDKEKLRKDKLKAKRKARRAEKKKKNEQLALQSDVDKYIQDQKAKTNQLSEAITVDDAKAQTAPEKVDNVSGEQVISDEMNVEISGGSDNAENQNNGNAEPQKGDDDSEMMTVTVAKTDQISVEDVIPDEMNVEIVSTANAEIQKGDDAEPQKDDDESEMMTVAMAKTNEITEESAPSKDISGDIDCPESILDVQPVEDTVIVELTSQEKLKGVNWLALDVCEPIVKALLELGFTQPTPIQQACIPAGLLRYKDVIGAAETGSGKTLAFGIPLIQRVMKLKSEDSVKGLVLCPTRELALQVTEHLVAASKYTGVRIVPILGGIAAPKQQRLLSYKPPILVATPGRLWQLIQEHEYLQDLSSIKFLVVDEADRMVEDGHFEEVTQIIGRIPTAEQRNTFLFSATLAFTIDRLDEKAKKAKKTKQERRAEKKGDAGIEMLVKNIGIREKVEKVDLTQKKGTAQLLTETYFMCNVEDKDLYLYYLLLNHPGKTLVFANAIDGVMNLIHIMKLLELPVHPLHSALQQRQRFKFLEKFKESDNVALICTDIAARGLDIPEVDTVIHYQLPSTKEAYIHRSGRTARAEKSGLSIAIVGPKDFKSYKKVASQMSEFPVEYSRLRPLRDSLQHARKIFKIERLRTRPEQKEAKLVALAKEAGLEDEEKVETPSDTKREVKILKNQLKALLAKPVLDSARYKTTKGAMQDLQTVSTFSLGVSALKHSKSKVKKK